MEADFGTTVLKDAELIQGVGCCLLCQEKFLPGIVEDRDVAWLRDSYDDIGPSVVFIGLAPCRFLINILHDWQTSKITNEIFAILLVNEPLPKLYKHLLHLISLKHFRPTRTLGLNQVGGRL